MCICKVITDKNVEDDIYGGASSFSEIRDSLGLLAEAVDSVRRTLKTLLHIQ